MGRSSTRVIPPPCAASVGRRTTLRPNAAHAERFASHAKEQAWREAGASNDLIQDLVWGIHVPTVGRVPAFRQGNYASYFEAQSLADAALEELRAAGKIELVPPGEVGDTVISPLGAVPKPEPNKIRVIHDLSLAVNDWVVTRDLRLLTIEDFLRHVSKDCWFWKRDWKGGYQQFWVEHSSRRLLGFEWKGKVWRFAVLPFGLNSSVADFFQFSLFVRSLLLEDGVLCWIYIDDLYGLNNSRDGALGDFNKAAALHERLHIEENREKAVPPTQVAVILGYEVDSRALTVTVPEKKRLQTSELCTSFLSRSSASLKEVQTLVGKLVFVARVVRGGWIFLQNLLPLLHARGRACVGLTKKSQSDLKW